MIPGGRALLVSQRLNGIEARSFLCRIKAEEDTYCCCENSRSDNGTHQDEHRPADSGRDHKRRADSEENSNGSTNQTQYNCLYQELPLNVSLRCTDGHADSDLACALGNRDEHDVHDAYATHQERDAGD